MVESEQSDKTDIQLFKQHYVLLLYIAGTTIQSVQALQNLKKICNQYLEGYYQLKVIDIYQQPKLAALDNVHAVPTLIKKSPHPLQKIIGNLSDTEKVLLRLNITSKS